MSLSEREQELIKSCTEQVRNSASVQTYQLTKLEQFEHLDQRFYDNWTEQATPWGFRWLADIESPSINEREGIRTAIRVLLDNRGEHCCVIWQLKPKWYLRWLSVLFRMGPLKVAELETRFNDDTCVVTTMAKEQADIFHPPEVVSHSVKAELFEQLYEWHRLHVSEHLAESEGRAVSILQSPQDVISMQQLMDRHKMKHMQKHHFLAIEMLPKSLQNNAEKRAAALAWAEQLHAGQPAPPDTTEQAARPHTDQPPAVTQQANEPGAGTALPAMIKQLGLKASNLARVDISQHPEPAWILGSDHQRLLQDWQKLRTGLRGRYCPVITQLFIQGEDLAQQVADLELLSRYNYATEMEMNDDCGFSSADPRAVLTASEQIDHQQAVNKLLREQLIFDKAELAEEVDYALEGLETELGAAPKADACQAMVRDGRIKHSAAWQGWLLNWVLKHHREAAVKYSQSDLTADHRVTNPAKFPGGASANPAIVLLPIQASWQVPALIHSEVVEVMGSAAFCALAKHWQTQYQATIIGMDNCTIEWHVAKPPKTVKEAMQLALLHNALAPSMLAQPGIEVWQYALSLVGRKRWCLWESPC